jgi:hypothetical protein
VTGLGIGAVAISNLHPTTLVGVDLRALPIAAVMAALTAGVFTLGRSTASRAASTPMLATVVVGLVAGACATAYAVAPATPRTRWRCPDKARCLSWPPTRVVTGKA